MGAKQSALKKEVAALQHEARKRSAKHQEELAAVTKEKRQLQGKIDELHATVTQAQEEAEKTKAEAREREERMKALKWELVRQLRVTGSPTPTSSRGSLSPSSSTRIALNWRLNDDVVLRQSVLSPKGAAASPKEAPAPNDTATSTNRPLTTTTSLLAPRRSLLKNSEPASTIPNPDQAFDTKEVNQPSEATASKLRPTSLPDSKIDSGDTTELKQDDDDDNDESKIESSYDDSPHRFSDTKAEDNGSTSAASAKSYRNTAQSKDSDEDSPRSNNICNFSEDDSSNSS